MTTPSPLDAIPREHLIEMLLKQVHYTNRLGGGYSFEACCHPAHPTPSEALLAHWRRCYPEQSNES